jgi:glycosyltransferase involved in cell wall biosynthesis
MVSKSLASNTTAVIPCYNDGLYIMQALQSLYNQTLLPERIIIVDDGSASGTKKILENIHHPLVEIIYQENQGVSVARNRAIEKAQTAYVLNLDADDYYEPTFIGKAVEILDGNQNVGVVSSHCRRFKYNNKTKETLKPLGGNVKDFIVINNGNGNSLFRKKCWEEVGGFDEKMRTGYEDWEFWIAITKHNWLVHILPEVLSHYRIKKKSRDTSAIQQHDLELRNYIYTKHKKVYEEHIDFYVSELLRQNSLLRTTIFNVKRSKEYTLGQLVLGPMRFIKKILFSK